MKFYHIADVHLGAAPDMPKGFTGDRSAEIWQTFREVLARAKEDQVDFLLITGDLFHRQPLLRELKEVDYLFASISPVRVILQAGNHDYLRHDSRYLNFNFSNNVVMFKEEEIQCLFFEQEQTYIYGNSYQHIEIETPMYDYIKPLYKPGIHILMAHGGDGKHIPMNLKQILGAGFDYVAMGHIHKPAFYSQGKMAYAGALVPIDINDVGTHGYVKGEITEEGIHTLFVPTGGREYVHLEIMVESGMTWSEVMDHIVSEIRRIGKKHLYKVILKGFTTADIDKDYAVIAMLGNIVAIQDETLPDIDVDALYEANRDNLIGGYIKRIREIPADEEAKQKALTLGIRALLQ